MHLCAIHVQVGAHAPDLSVCTGHGATQGIAILGFTGMWQDVVLMSRTGYVAQTCVWVVQMKPNKLQLPGNFCTALGLNTRDKWSLFLRTETLFSNCPTAGVRRKGLFQNTSASAIDASFCLAHVTTGRMSVSHGSLSHQALSSPPEVADWYLEVLAKMAYYISCYLSQEVLDHFATNSSDPMDHEPLVSETDAKVAGQFAATILDFVADARPCFIAQGPM